MNTVADSGKPQADKFRAAAEEALCDLDEKRWEGRLRKVAGHKPAPEPETAKPEPKSLP